MSVQMPPPAPRSFPFKAASAKTRFLLVFGGIWASVGLPSVIVTAALAPLFTVIGPAFFLVCGSVIAFVGWTHYAAEREIYSNGTAVEATVTAIERTVMRMNRQRIHRVRYVFSSSEGDVHGELTSVSPPAVGAKIWILHLPAEPKKNVAA